MELDCCEAVGEGRRGTGKVDMMQASWPYYADGDDMESLSSALHAYIYTRILLGPSGSYMICTDSTDYRVIILAAGKVHSSLLRVRGCHV